jgi:hypothetical protein
MTSFSILPPQARPSIRLYPSVLAVVALLLSALAPQAVAQTAVQLPIAYFPSTVDSVVSKVTNPGPILDVLDGALQLDLTNAKITFADDTTGAGPLATALAILPGSRVVAQVTVPDAVATAFPARLSATSVVVFLADSGNLSGVIQQVLAPATFILLDTPVKTNSATTWSGTKADGSPVKGFSDLSIGMQANVAVTADTSGVTAKSVFAYARPTTRIVAFRGKVDSIDVQSSTSAIWTISGNLVQVTPDTKLVGSPGVGDTVDVLEKVQILPPGSLAPTMIPVAISITKVVILPPPPPGRTVEFDGVVESLPPVASPSSVPLGHWKISTEDGLRDVLVNSLTKVDSGIVVGSKVHVKGVIAPVSVLAPTATLQIVATSITKL